MLDALYCIDIYRKSIFTLVSDVVAAGIVEDSAVTEVIVVGLLGFSVVVVSSFDVDDSCSEVVGSAVDVAGWRDVVLVGSSRDVVEMSVVSTWLLLDSLCVVVVGSPDVVVGLSDVVAGSVDLVVDSALEVVSVLVGCTCLVVLLGSIVVVV